MQCFLIRLSRGTARELIEECQERFNLRMQAVLAYSLYYLSRTTSCPSCEKKTGQKSIKKIWCPVFFFLIFFFILFFSRVSNRIYLRKALVTVSRGCRRFCLSDEKEIIPFQRETMAGEMRKLFYDSEPGRSPNFLALGPHSGTRKYYFPCSSLYLP